MKSEYLDCSNMFTTMLSQFTYHEKERFVFYLKLMNSKTVISKVRIFFIKEPDIAVIGLSMIISK